MPNNLNTVSIITARIGSKRLKNKNIKIFKNKPLIYYSIKNSLESKYINHTLVSTDSKTIAKISKKYGADVPFLRNKKLSGDKISTYEVIKGIIGMCEKYYKKKFDLIVILQPTSPLRKTEELNKAILKLKKNKVFSSVVSVSKKINVFLNKNKIRKKNNKYIFQNSNNNFDSNDLFINGSIYVIRRNNLRTDLFGKNIYPLETNYFNNIDIDNISDFKIAELIASRNNII